MQVAKDAVDADILVNNGGTSISRENPDSFACNSEYFNDF